MIHTSMRAFLKSLTGDVGRHLRRLYELYYRSLDDHNVNFFPVMGARYCRGLVNRSMFHHAGYSLIGHHNYRLANLVVLSVILSMVQ